jgi:O-antigen ligase
LLLLPFVIAQVAWDWTRITWLAETWVAGAAIAGAVGTASYLGLIHGLSRNPEAAAVVRVYGLTTQPNVYGSAAAMAIPIAAFFCGSTKGAKRACYFVALIVLLVAVGLSGSRAAIVGGVFGLCVLAVTDPGARAFLKRAAIVAIGLILAVGLASFRSVPVFQRLFGGSERTTTEVATSDKTRETIYPKVWSEIEHRPIVGHGFEYLRGSHNIYLEVLHAGGAIGLVALLLLLFGVFKVGLSRVPSTASNGLIRALFASALSWLAVIGLTETGIFDRYHYVPIALLVSVWAVSRKAAPADQPSKPRTPILALAARGVGSAN